MKGELKAGRYKIEEEIGRGGMGIVYRARDARLKRTVALKMLSPEMMRDAEIRRRLAQEARAASALSHPAVATVYDFEEQADETFIVYEFVEGETLRARLNRHRFTTEEILDIGIQLAGALTAAHERGITHRDMKPDNIMLIPSPERPGRVKVLDFGLAKFHQPLRSASQVGDSLTGTGALATAPGLLVGTVNYMSPEQLTGQPVDPRTDLYGLGLVLYEMATGVNPFVGSSATSTIANILTQEAPSLSTRNPVAPAELDRVLRKCLRKPPEERFQSARELLVDLSDLRRDLARQQAGTVPAPTSVFPETPLTISRGLARGLFLLIQVGYLALYSTAVYYLPNIQRLQMVFGFQTLAILIAFGALSGATIRLYMLSAVSFDYPDSGRLFKQVFPGILLLDLAWALSPLLLLHKVGHVALLFIVGLIYLPFSQRNLVYSAYAPHGGRTSGIKAASSL